MNKNYTPANLRNSGSFNPYYELNNEKDPEDDSYLGLGGESIDWKNSPSLSKEQDNNSAIYDGYGNFTTPYSTASRYIDRRHISMHTYFYTQRDEYDAYYVVGKKDNPQATVEKNQHEFSQELAGFHTDNQNKGIPTMQIYLFGYRDWEQILKPNDYVAIRVWETYPDMPSIINGNSEDQQLHPRDTQGIRRRTLMVGLISQIQLDENATSSARVYVITCQGMQKVLADINLGLPKTAQWNDVNLLYDINGESSPYNEQFPTYGNGSTSSNSSSGGQAKETGSQREKEYISWCNSHGLNAAQTAGLAGNSVVEAGCKPDWSGGTNNWFGMSKPGTQTAQTVPSSVSVTDYLNYTILHKGHYSSFSELAKCPGGFYAYRSETKSMSAYKCADWWCNNVEDTQAANADQVKGDRAEQIYKQIK